MYRVVALIRYTCESILDAILPPRERTARTKEREAEDIPLTHETHDLLENQIVTLMNYREQASEDLIRSLKYDRSWHAAELCATLLADYLREEIASHRSFSTRRLLLVPVPLHTARMRERGFNQVELVLRALSKEFIDTTNIVIAPHALARTRETKSQAQLPRSERLSNVAGAFIAPNAALINKAHIYLIDDVTTTGATLVHAAAPLRRGGADVTLIALARA